MSEKHERNVTIGKIVVALIAIGILFIPVYAVHAIEARAIDHALAIEGLYINGTAVDILDFDNDTFDVIETFYPAFGANYSTDEDSVCVYHGGSGYLDLFYRDRATYVGNGTYDMSYNLSEEGGTMQTRKLFIPLELNATQWIEVDFIRIQSNWEYIPEIVLIDGLSMSFIGDCVEVSTDNYIQINTIQTRTILADHPDCQMFLYYQAQTDPDITEWSVKIQTETYTGADTLTWTDETLYIITVLLCDILFIGAIVFASDPIDIVFDGSKKRK
jgi:hypothetical protein